MWLDNLLLEKPADEVTLLSPLASGADQLVAELALVRGIPLHVPLPYPLERYIADFKVGKEREQFYSLYERATHSYVPELALKQQEDALGYFAVGAYVAQKSHLLFALWNGKKAPEKTGGTAHILRCQLQGFPAEFMIPAAVCDRQTVWIQTQRSEDGTMSAKGILLTNKSYQSIGKEDDNGH
jgi:hypothetical protein